MRWKFETSFRILFFVLVGLLLWSIWASAQGTTGASVIEFTQPTFSANENARAAPIKIRRTGNLNAAAAVEFATADDTAVAGVHYLAKTVPVTFSAGQSEAKVLVPLLGRSENEARRKLRLTLSNPTGGATLGALNTAELLLVDNPTGQKAWLTFGLDRVPWLRRTVFEIPLWQYLASLIFIFLAFYVSKLLDFLIRGRLKQWAQKTHTKFDNLFLELVRGPIKVVSFVILLHIGLRIFYWPEYFADFISKALKIVVAISLTYMAMKIVDLLTNFWRQRATPEDSFNKQLLPLIRNSLKVFVVIVAVLLTLQNLGLNITSLIASLSIGGLAISLGAQDTLANLFGAVAVLSDKPFQVGDHIKFDQAEGIVESIGLRSTRVRNLDGNVITVPNKTVANSAITNILRRPTAPSK